MRLIDHKVAKDLHPTKNKDIDLSTITCHSKIRVWWLCKRGHEHYTGVRNRTHKKSKGCPYCSGLKKYVSLAISHPELSKQWHPDKNGELTPDKVTSGCVKEVWWRGKCGHEWIASIRIRAGKYRISPDKSKFGGCPYCSNIAVDDTNSLATMVPDVAVEWHPTKNGDLTPDKVNYRTYKEAYWLGKCGHEWKTKINTRTRKRRPAGCPVCKQSHGEVSIEKTLNQLGLSYEKQVRFTTCKDKRSLPFDFKVGNLLIEFQGAHHFQEINYGGDGRKLFAMFKRHDKIKKKWCCNNGYRLLEIHYKDFDLIREILTKTLEKEG